MNRQHLDDRRLHDRALLLAASAIDFDLTSAETGELEAHLATCPTCARRAAALRADASTLGRPLTLLPSRRVDDAVYAAIAQRPARPQRLWLLAAAVLLLVALLLGAVGVGAYLLRTRQTLPISIVPTPTAPAVVVGETWQALAIPASDIGSGWIGLMKAVAVTESGFVAVGAPVCAPQNDPTTCHASVWTAATGAGWTRVPDQPALELGLTVPTSGPEKGMFDVVEGPAGIVAIGHPYDDRGTGIWRSHDGRTWERVDGGAIFTNATISAVTSGSANYVIVGTVADPASATAPARAAAWASPDGLVWTRATDSAAMAAGSCVDTGETPFCAGMLAVAAIATGFVAVGETCPGTFEGCRPAAWTTADGANWVRSDTGLDFNGLLTGVTAGGPGLVAVGTICQPSCFNVSPPGVAATSRDGSTWTFSPVAGATELKGVASAGGHSFALGARNEFPALPAELQLWRSDDGIAWERVRTLPSIPDAASYPSVDIAAAADRLVIVGWVTADIAHDSGLPFLRNLSLRSP